MTETELAVQWGHVLIELALSQAGSLLAAAREIHFLVRIAPDEGQTFRRY